MNEQVNYDNIVSDIHNGKYHFKSVRTIDPNAEMILADYISGIPEEIDAVVEHAKNQGYTFSELISLVAQSGVKKGLNLS